MCPDPLTKSDVKDILTHNASNLMMSYSTEPCIHLSDKEQCQQAKEKRFTSVAPITEGLRVGEDMSREEKTNRKHFMKIWIYYVYVSVCNSVCLSVCLPDIEIPLKDEVEA